MFLSRLSPTFATLALTLVGQAAKGIEDNVNHYNKRQRGGALFTVLKNAAKIGYKLGKDKRYKRIGAKGVIGSYNRRPALWEVRFDYADNGISWRLFSKRPIRTGDRRC